MRLRFTSDALAHLESIHDFLTGRNPAAARRIAAEIRKSALLLCEFPHIGRKGEVPDTHEWMVQGSPYLIVYEINGATDEVMVLGVFHGAQNRQDLPK